MKNQLTLLLLTLIGICLFSCAEQKPSPLGKWFPVAVDSEYISSYQLSKADLESMMKNNSIELTPEGKFIAISPHDTARGTYSYDEKGKHLTTAVGASEPIQFTIEFPERNKMILGTSSGKITLARK